MRLIEFVENVQAEGKLWFTKAQAMQAIGCNYDQLQKALYKLAAKKRINVVKSPFVTIVPVEHKDRGFIPADWFIDPLMQYLELPYYIAILSAAEYYGAAHQQPMQFQVITEKAIKPIKYNWLHVKFVICEKTVRFPTIKQQSRSGWVQVSTPEVTALDLCKYYRQSGHLSNVATVLAELQEQIDPEKLFKLAHSNLYGLPVIQRLGYLLSLPEVGAKHLVAPIAGLIIKEKSRWILLQPGQAKGRAKKDPIWRVYVNEDIEVDI